MQKITKYLFSGPIFFKYQVIIFQLLPFNYIDFQYNINIIKSKQMQTRYRQKISGIIDMALDKQKDKDTNKKSIKKEVKATPNSKQISQPKIQSIQTQTVKSKSDLLQQRLKMLKKKKQQADSKAAGETKKNEMVAEVIEAPFVQRTRNQSERNVSDNIQHREQKQIEKEGKQESVLDKQQKSKQHNKQQQQKAVQHEVQSKQEGYSNDQSHLQQKQYQNKIVQSTEKIIDMQKQEFNEQQQQHIDRKSHQNQEVPSESQEHVVQQPRLQTIPSQQQQPDQNKNKLQQYLSKLRNQKSSQSGQKKKKVIAEKEEQTVKSKQKAQEEVIAEKDKSNFSPMEAQIFDVLDLKGEAGNKQVQSGNQMKDQKEQKMKQVVATKSVEKNDVKQKLEKIKQKQQQLRKQKERIKQMQRQEQVAKQRERERKIQTLAQLQKKQQERIKQKVKQETIKKFHQQLQQKQKLREIQKNADKMQEQNTQKQKQKQEQQQQQQQEEQRKIGQQESMSNEKAKQKSIVEEPLEQNDIVDEQQPDQKMEKANEQTSQLYDWWSHPIICKRQKQIQESGDKAERIRSKIALKQLYQLRYLMNDIEKNLQPSSGQGKAQPKQIMKTTTIKLLLLQAKLNNAS